jgi:hypothetical protein
MLAVRNYHLEVVKMLVEAGADSEQQNKVSAAFNYSCLLLLG